MIKVVQKFLQINRYGSFKNEFEDLFLSHPNYPSLFAITDSFDLLGIENAAVKIPKEQILDLPASFLAYFNDELVLVAKNDKGIVLDTIKGKRLKITYEQFLLDWSGVIVAIEPNKTYVKEDNAINFKWLRYILPVLILIFTSMFYYPYKIIDYFFLGSAILGFTISVFIVQEKFGFKNNFFAQFCNRNANMSCDNVLKSDTVFSGTLVNFADLPLIFFGTILSSILIWPHGSGVFIGFLSSLAIPVVVSSIWIQKFELKKWCVLCLMVSALILVQSVIWFSTNQFTLNFELTNVLPFFFSFLFVLTVWLSVKTIIKHKIEIENELQELKKFKRNYNVLNFLSRDVPVTNGFSSLSGLNFGNRNAPIKLSLILSPSCNLCFKAFQDAFELVLKSPERVFLKILFNVNPENNDNSYKVVVERLLIINKVTPGKIVEAISDWYIKKFDLKEWSDKWQVENTSMMVNQEIQKQYDWCSVNNFNYTPVKIVNDKVYPNEYELQDLKYFLNEFVEESNLVLEQTA
ncbi:hypothetical protein GON26_15900 [Flavobacterium sp. GA093]|uniref:Vitamin K epoxide reductase domain-containing protein n=1 Tax=Flavobacterium hydrocarbonoxydans TaxID=2683249 RepID=A0A6I4NNP5_9FLAO|nr:vitamin K epoxide reductase family protein [Flavobacterium hydrocarbonoxydans]MWB95850.1 hypothetical protein [Flavobacterium hydrocarbonoxydans]